MITDQDTNTLFFADDRVADVKTAEAYRKIRDFLRNEGVQIRILEGTRDIWVRDFMPIQVSEHKMLKFDYNPSYLDNDKYLNSKTSNEEVASICAKNNITLTLSDIKLDGGNIVKCKDAVILTDRILADNTNYSTSGLLKKLEDLFECEVYIIPSDPEKKIYGHSDGVLAYIDDNKLLVTKYPDSKYIIKIFGIRVIIKHKTKFEIPDIEDYGLNRDNRDYKIIVSLTSYPKRIKTVHNTIKTLLTQDFKPDIVILWLEKSEFKNGENDLPKELVELKKFGLSIEWSDDNLKSYKKLIPALIKYPDYIIVTADDDVLYSKTMLKSLYEAWLKDKSNIYVKRAVRLKLKNDTITNISSRKYDYKDLDYPSYLNHQMGGSGCLYPPNSLHKDCTDINKIKSLIPTHDDVYFKVMATLNRTRVKVVGGYNEDLIFTEGTQDVGLINTNKSGGDGVSLDEAFRIMTDKYPQIIDIIKEEFNG